MFNSKEAHKCSGCNQIKAKTLFPKQSAKKSGVNSFCKECHAKRHRQRKYGNCSNGGILETLVHTEGACMICGETVGKMCVDHCHATNVIRGILCNNCNVGIANFKDNSQLLFNAINYLKTYGDGYVF
jgi:hypothetical protein